MLPERNLQLRVSAVCTSARPDEKSSFLAPAPVLPVNPSLGAALAMHPLMPRLAVVVAVSTYLLLFSSSSKGGSSSVHSRSPKPCRMRRRELDHPQPRTRVDHIHQEKPSLCMWSQRLLPSTSRSLLILHRNISVKRCDGRPRMRLVTFFWFELYCE